MKGSSEGAFREALNAVDLRPFVVYKPPDDARNWKPADYMVWWPSMSGTTTFIGGARSAWFEVKDPRTKGGLPVKDITPTQWAAIAQADQLGLPYFFAIRWPDSMWTIADGIRIGRWLHGQGVQPTDHGYPLPWGHITSIPRALLDSRFGVSAVKAQLAQVIKVALVEGL